MAKIQQPADGPIPFRSFKEATQNPTAHVGIAAADVADKTIVVYDWLPKKSEAGWEYPVIVATVEGMAQTFEITGGKTMMAQLRDIAPDGFPFQAILRVMGKTTFFE